MVSRPLSCGPTRRFRILRSQTVDLTPIGECSDSAVTSHRGVGCGNQSGLPEYFAPGGGFADDAIGGRRRVATPARYSTRCSGQVGIVVLPVVIADGARAKVMVQIRALTHDVDDGLASVDENVRMLKGITQILQITPWEREALRLLATGRWRDDAALGLGVGTQDMETLLAKLFAAMGVTTQAEAIAAARKRGLLA